MYQWKSAIVFIVLLTLIGCGKEETEQIICYSLTQSDLPGVSIEFPHQSCDYTIEQAQLGFYVDYIVKINETITDVIPRALDTGDCEKPGPSGLVIHYQFGDDPYVYCQCNTQLCTNEPLATVTLEPGEFASHVWVQARQWQGPSDTNEMPGDPFPVGEYDVILVAEGVEGVALKAWPFHIIGRYQVRLH
ncbi:MAG: hypothetical protein JW841_01420 [Deltaproteobacteria bacterium]|nr:hypothetical protein [Deltaproteobacteria bacterium]